MVKPNICILRTDGTNCDEELFYAFEKVGASPLYVHVNELRRKEKKLKDFQVLAFPGGFSYGDDVASGKILAVELISYLKDELQGFIDKKGIVLGICNGFQTLVRTGLLPFGKMGEMSVTLAQNESGHFECRWVNVTYEKSTSVFLPASHEVFHIAINSGEGRVFSDTKTIDEIEKEHLVAVRYVNEEGQPTQEYPDNPNGSMHAIAGLTDPTGRIFGMQPHPEKFVDITQYPNWRREKISKPHGLYIFENMMHYLKNE